MTKKILYILIVSICISLIGMITVQYFWISNALKVKEAQFNRSVNDALATVVNKIEARENMNFISRNFEGDSIMRIVQEYSRDTMNDFRDRLDSLLVLNKIPAHSTRRKLESVGETGKQHEYIGFSYEYHLTPEIIFQRSDSMTLHMEHMVREFEYINNDNLAMEWQDHLGKLDSLMGLQFTFSSGMQELNDPDLRQMQSGQIIITSPGWSGAEDLRILQPGIDNHKNLRRNNPATNRKESRDENLQKLDKKAKKIEEVIKQMAIAIETKPAPIQQRINKKTLQETLSKSLADKGIHLPFEFAVASDVGDSTRIPIRSPGFTNEFLKTGHKVSLFPNDLFNKSDLLLIHFDGQKAHVMKSLWLLLVGSILFTLIIILSSGASIIVMIRQKKISDVKTDFINNMTHEFKTPLATISIAADSINNPKVLTEPETIRNFTRIIKEENNRMNARVEQVLQMALLDSRDFTLKPVITDINKLIISTVEHFRLQIETRHGSIKLSIGADQQFAFVDEDHMRNVLINLLDNANKYSVNKPDIQVFTANKGGRIIFGVADKGLGMTNEVQRRAFDKFFRVTSGNIHNIKGFGLGLSYVRAIVLAHKGEITVHSEVGQGSRFEISLPLVPGYSNLL